MIFAEEAPAVIIVSYSLPEIIYVPYVLVSMVDTITELFTMLSMSTKSHKLIFKGADQSFYDYGFLGFDEKRYWSNIGCIYPTQRVVIIFLSNHDVVPV